MTQNDIDWASIATLPTLTIDGSDLDRLELALSMAGCRLRLHVPSADAGTTSEHTRDVVLVDRQATPLAQLPGCRPGSAARAVALRPRSAGHTIEWSDDVRMTAAALRARLAALGVRRVVGVAFDRLPTLADVHMLSAELERDDTAIVVAALVGAPERGAHPDSAAEDGDAQDNAGKEHDALRAGAAALTRAVSGLADELRGFAPDRAIALALPWSRHPSPGLLELQGEGLGPDALIERLLHAYGVSDVVSPLPPTETENAIADAGAHWRDEIAQVLPPASAQELGRRTSNDALPGAVVLFTGLSGSGKSTLAQAVATALRERGERASVLDGDDMRRHLSSELGFDRRSRSLNVQRIGWVAALAASHGGVALAAPIAPFAADRAEVRAMAEASGAFLLVYVATPLEECARRDRKGLYARAMAGEIPEFTGVSSPYEVPADADVVVDTSTEPIEESLERVLQALEHARASGPLSHDA